MTVLDVDPAVYYDVGNSCTRLARDFFTVVDTHLRDLVACGHMAGSYDEAESWARSYDRRAAQTTDMISTLAEAMHHYGDVVLRLGFNHATADYDAARALGPGAGPTPVKPPAPPDPAFVCWIPLPSAGGAGGLLDSGLGLVETIGITVPDGDTGLLNTAACTWRSIAAEPALSALPGELNRLALLFQDITAPETEFIDVDLRAMQSAAEDILSALTDLAISCDEHRQLLDELRDQLLTELKGLADELLKELAITAAVGIAASFVTFGLGAIAATARAASVAARFAQPLRRIIEVWKSAKNIGRGVRQERDLHRHEGELERIKEIGNREVDKPARRLDSPPVDRPSAVPDGWSSRPADNGRGIVWQKPGSVENADTVRIMEPTAQYPDGYVRYYNSFGQPLNLAGKPGNRATTHIPMNPDGSFQQPAGW
ncbi:hypothetical protein ACNHUS_19050 [Actinomycetes bacterium M1A6_2h]